MFSFRKKITNTSLLQGMTDVHAHLLPGVDDGVRNTEEAVQILQQMQQLGVKRIFLTPHISDEWLKNNNTWLQEQFEALLSSVPPGLQLHLAAEYMLDAGFKNRIKSGLLTFPGNLVLVETSYLAAPLDLYDLLYSTIIEGYQPVLAHPERYLYLKEADYDRLKNKGCRFQLNLFSLAGMYGRFAQEKAAYLLKQDLYDFIGSDCHSLSGYQAGLDRIRLKKKQIEALSPLMENNRNL